MSSRQIAVIYIYICLFIYHQSANSLHIYVYLFIYLFIYERSAGVFPLHVNISTRSVQQPTNLNYFVKLQNFSSCWSLESCSGEAPNCNRRRTSPPPSPRRTNCVSACISCTFGRAEDGNRILWRRIYGGVAVLIGSSRRYCTAVCLHLQDLIGPRSVLRPWRWKQTALQ